MQAQASEARPDMSGIRTTFHVFNTGKCSPYNTGETLFEGRPQPEKGGQDNINGTVKFYKGDICEVIAAGGGSNSANGGWSGFDGGSGAAFKGKIKILKTVEVTVQVGAKTNKNTYPLKKNTFIGDFIIAEGATGATDYNYEQYADGVLTINNVSWAELYSTPEIQTNGQRSGSYQPIPGTNYGQEFYTGYLKITKIDK